VAGTLIEGNTAREGGAVFFHSTGHPAVTGSTLN
jgi:hypothetical protein